MTLQLIFWITMLSWFIFGTEWSSARANWRPAAGNLLLFVLLVVLGWSVYGAPIKA
jgi:hypothetical protein